MKAKKHINRADIKIHMYGKTFSGKWAKNFTPPTNINGLENIDIIWIDEAQTISKQTLTTEKFVPVNKGRF